MRYRKIFLIPGIAASVIFVGIATAAFLVSHRFEHIGENSILSYLVDTDIRKVPLNSGDAILTYDSVPVDGTASAVDAIRIRTSNKTQSKQLIVKYLIDLGYRLEDDSTFRKENDKITIDESNDGLEVSKFSWD